MKLLNKTATLNFEPKIENSKTVHHSNMTNGSSNSINDLETIEKDATRTIDNSNHKRNKSRNVKLMRSMKDKIYTEANVLNKKQDTLNKKIFRIIDKTRQKKKIFNAEVDKDLAAILDAKKKKKKKREAEEIYTKAVKINNEFSLMDSRKADLLRASDVIYGMTDLAALKFADDIKESYYMKTRDADNKNNLRLAPDCYKRKVRMKMNMLRDRVSDNNRKLVRMAYCAEKNKQNLLDAYDNLNIK